MVDAATAQGSGTSGNATAGASGGAGNGAAADPFIGLETGTRDWIGTKGYKSVSDVAKALRMSLASASALSERLVRLGCVRRRSDPRDRRTVILALAPTGERLLERLERRSTEKLSQAIRQMTEQERTALAASLRAFLRVAPLVSPAGPRTRVTSTKASR